MKVVLFCGGLGMRLREYSETIPKPMVTIGYRPILWHVMKYYAHYGHKEFILCLGHGADVIKSYFLNYNECLSNDFVLSQGGKRLKLLSSDIQDWKITFVDTGATASIAQRMKAAAKYLNDDEMFMANYSDSLTDLHLPTYLDQACRRDRVASMLWVKPNVSFHFVVANADGTVREISDATKSQVRINGGYFLFKKEIFGYIHNGEELVNEPFQRLVREQQLIAHKYDGFWAAMDTFKDKQVLDTIYASGSAPWEVWRHHETNGRRPQAVMAQDSASTRGKNTRTRSARPARISV